MKKLVVPVVCREVLTDHPVLIISHAEGDMGVIYREDGRRLGLAVFAEMWWETHFFPINESPKAYAEVLKSYALHCGADPDAARVLRRFTQVTDEEFTRMTTVAKPPAKTMADRKKAVETNAGKGGIKKEAIAKTPKTATSPEDKAAKKQANLAKLKALNEEKKAARAAAGPKEKKATASSMFCDLILEGKQTDDQIFAAVQKAFGIDDSKRSYVGWYRNKLRKDGSNPPAAKK
jgi:hypothetical protein